jgi:hypothetical protein
MQQHSECLLEVLNVVLERTYAVAPKRQKTYELNRSERRNPRLRERLLEKAIWLQWRAEAVALQGQYFVPALCRHIQTYQMPLQGHRADKSWGKIDILGVTMNGLPMVLELKKEDAAEPPLRILAEGLAYAVAVRRAWNEGSLQNQWNRDVTPLSRDFANPSPLLEVPVIGIAPTEYWNRCIGEPGRRSVAPGPRSIHGNGLDHCPRSDRHPAGL